MKRSTARPDGETIAAPAATIAVRPPRPLDALRVGSTKSLNAALIEQLRTDLLDGTIRPGIKLKIPDICKSYRVSPGVAREALSRLVPEGLIDFEDQRGFRSPPVTVEGIKDITRVRLLIEREALCDAMRHGDDAWESKIIATQYRLARCEDAAGGSPDHTSVDWTSRHKAFHQALVAACTSPWLLRLHNMFYDQTERYRFISAKVRMAPMSAPRDVAREHREIVEAVIERNEERAIGLMEAHLLRTSERVIAACCQGGAPA